MVSHDKNVLLFGATGAIGSALVTWFVERGWNATGISRGPVTAITEKVRWIQWDPQIEKSVPSQMSDSYQAVVWAQGINFSDNVFSFDRERHLEMYSANIMYILDALNALLNLSLLAQSCRLVVVSSIWQEIARQNKLSYIITKSALKGLVQSLTIDLGKMGYLVNAVLPGALDTPMTRSNLTEQQIIHLEKATPLGSLATLADVCQVIGFLCSPENTGVTGQFITVDRGFSYARIL